MGDRAHRGVAWRVAAAADPRWAFLRAVLCAGVAGLCGHLLQHPAAAAPVIIRSLRFRSRYSAAAPATWNPELATLRAAVGRSRSKAARWSGCSGGPGLPSSSPACSRAGPTARSFWVTAGRPCRRGLDLDQRAGPVVIPAGRRAVSRPHWVVDAAPAAPLGAHPRRRGRHQPARCWPVLACLGPLPGALCPAGTRGDRPPPRRDRPGTPPTVTHSHLISRPAAA